MTVPVALISPAGESNLERKQSLMKALLFVGMSMLTVMIHAYLVAVFGAVGFVWFVGVTALSLFVSWEFAFALLVTLFFLQNAFIALASPAISDPAHFTPLQGTSFLAVCMMSLIAVPVWQRMRRLVPPQSSRFLYWMLIFIAIVLVYSVWGAAQTSIPGVLTYTRVYLVGALMLAIGIAMGFQLRISYVVSVIRIIAVMLVVWGLLEFFFTEWLYTIFNLVDFLHLEYSKSSDPESLGTLRDIIATGSSSYLNLSGSFGLDLIIIRLKGPNIHPISYAYGLAFCAMICFIYRYHFLLVATLFIMTLVGAKGPLLMILVPLMAYPFYLRTSDIGFFVRWLTVIMIAYIVIVIYYGTVSGDYHIIGLLGGIKGFFKNPIGHGVGMGGNLSNLALTQANFDFFQNFGADFALESAIGVMLYQVGVGSLVFFAFYRQVTRTVWQAMRALPGEPRLVAVPIALSVLFVNGLFQEEALSPEGWGIMFLFVGLLISRYWYSLLPSEPEANKA
jgi:hypothetical protein